MSHAPEKSSFEDFKVFCEAYNDFSNWSDIEEGIDRCVHNFLYNDTVEAVPESLICSDKEHDFNWDCDSLDGCNDHNMLHVLPVLWLLISRFFTGPTVFSILAQVLKNFT